jgi:hypothetical protein
MNIEEALRRAVTRYELFSITEYRGDWRRLECKLCGWHKRCRAWNVDMYRAGHECDQMRKVLGIKPSDTS